MGQLVSAQTDCPHCLTVFGRAPDALWARLEGHFVTLACYPQEEQNENLLMLVMMAVHDNLLRVTDDTNGK